LCSLCRFVLNGLVNANHILNQEVFNVDDWEVIGEYVHDSEGGRHQAFYSPRKDIAINGTLIKEAERVQIEQSLKYSEEEALTLWEKADLKEITSWSASTVAYSKLKPLPIIISCFWSIVIVFKTLHRGPTFRWDLQTQMRRVSVDG